MKKKILLSTLNAKYYHTAFGLRYLYANLKDLREDASIVEFTINQNPRDIAESILKFDPIIVGFGVYIWNSRQVLDVVTLIKKVRPSITIILGGPEISYETESQALYKIADFVICGEADLLFYQLCKEILLDGSSRGRKLIPSSIPDITKIELPYSLYNSEDISHRVIYVEASRGCPYKCEYCLSSLDKSVRSFELDKFLEEINSLIQRGARQFKFVDRTFNLSISTSSKILQFFLDRINLGLFLHFEMVPDRLPIELRDLIQKFPVGSLQFEVGIQTWNPEVANLVSRRQNYAKVRENITFLKTQSGVHIHADLIAGLPGETMDSFAKGFDELANLNPHEIQVGILKRLKGTPIMRHDQEWQMVYQDSPPFQVLQTKTMSFEELQWMGRFAHFWDLFANSGNFKKTSELFKSLSEKADKKSYFWFFFEFVQFLSERHPQAHGIALLNFLESIWIYLTEVLMLDRQMVREILIGDYTIPIRRDVPRFLRGDDCLTVSNSDVEKNQLNGSRGTLERQKRHIAV